MIKKMINIKRIKKIYCNFYYLRNIEVLNISYKKLKTIYTINIIV